MALPETRGIDTTVNALKTQASSQIPLQIQSIKGQTVYFEFQDFEIPELLNAGGTQTIAVHEFPGGVKTVQSLGAFPPKLTWKGFFYGTNPAGESAFLRAKQLDQLRFSGLNYLFVYGVWKWEGIITKLDINIHYQWHVEYAIEVEVIEDKSVTPVKQTQSLGSILVAALNNIVTSCNDPLNPYQGINYQGGSILQFATNAATAGNQTINFGGGQLSNVSQPSLISMINSFNRAFIAFTYINQQLQSGIPLLSISGISGLANPIFTTADPFISVAQFFIYNFGVAFNALGSQGTLYTQQRVINPDLFRLAAQYYGDPNQWTVIAVANGLNDPAPTGTFLLNIPQSSVAAHFNSVLLSTAGIRNPGTNT